MSTASTSRPRLSAVLITRDAQAHLRECLESLRFCDEIVVLDTGSSDGTRQICEQAGVKFSQVTDWPGFGPQKNRAIALASGDWVLSIDADEVCTPELRAAIEAALREPGAFAAFEMPRLSSFCGHWMRHGGWWPDRVTRLFRAGRARFSDDIVHEHLVVDGATGRLAPHLKHYTYDTLAQALQKQERYATMGAQQAFDRGARASGLIAVLRGAWAFVRTYVVRAGFLDGRAGLLLARYNARTTLLRYRKLAELSGR
jgi:glycosyltransferase involved in cell wall biosynthesis